MELGAKKGGRKEGRESPPSLNATLSPLWLSCAQILGAGMEECEEGGKRGEIDPNSPNGQS